MSLASVYAASQTSAATDQATANAGVPAPLVGAHATFSVTPAGNMLITKTDTAPAEATPAQAIAVANWINATFV
jgi:hypothetical protein